MRVYEGDNGLVLKRFFEEEVLFIVVKEGNCWLVLWVFWMFGCCDMVVRVFIVSFFFLFWVFFL